MSTRLPSVAYPPEEFDLVAHWQLDRPGHLASFRADLTRALRQQGASYSGGLTGVAEKMVLVASELATNAIVHALPPTQVRLLVSPREFLLDVIDHTPHAPPRIAERAVGEGGEGLKIAQRIALDVAWYPDGAAKHVWASFPRHAGSDQTSC